MKNSRIIENLFFSSIKVDITFLNPLFITIVNISIYYSNNNYTKIIGNYYLKINFTTRINIGAITILIEEMVLISVVFILDLYTKIKLNNLSIRIFRLKNKTDRTINATSNEINIEKSDKIIGYLKSCIKPPLISK